MKIFEFQHPEQLYSFEVFRRPADFSKDPQSFLNSTELNDLANMNNSERRSQYLHSRYHLKQKLSAMTQILPQEIFFEKKGEGKLVFQFENQQLDFNLSHSADLIALGFTQQGWIGIDLEAIRKSISIVEIAKKYFSAIETNFLLAEKNHEKQKLVFSKLWSGKEALLKAAAGGVFKNVREVNLNCENWSIAGLPKSFGNPADWQLHFFTEIESYILSVAFRKRQAG